MQIGASDIEAEVPKIGKVNYWTEAAKMQFLADYKQMGAEETANKYGMKKSSASVMASRIKHGKG